MSCPNKSLPDWSDLVQKLGEDGAYYVFMKNGEKVPYLQGRASNRFAWDVENEHKLVSWKMRDGKKVKQYKGFSRNEAEKIVNSIREKYIGDYTISRPAPDTTGEFALKIKGYPLLKKEVEAYMLEYDKSKIEALNNVKHYKEFKQREEEANEDIIPLSTYEQRKSLYDNSDTGAETAQEAFNLSQQQDLTSILQATMPDVKVIKDFSIEGIGELRPGKVVAVHPDRLINSTIGHEFGHLLIDLRGGLGNSFIAEAYEQLKDTDHAKRIRTTYEGGSETQIRKEIIAEAIGIETAKIFKSEEGKTKFEKWLLRFFRWIGVRTGITKNNARELSSELLKGKPLPLAKYAGKQAKTVQKQLPEGDLTDEEVANESQVGFRITKEESKVLSDIAKIRDKASEIISTRLRKADRGTINDDVAALKSLQLKLTDSELEDKRAVIEFAMNAVNYIDLIYRDYETAKKREEEGDSNGITIKNLTRWSSIMESYDILEDVISYVTTYGIGPNFPGYYRTTTKKYVKQLEEAVTKKEAVKWYFKKKGTEMVAEALLPYSTRVITIERNNKRREWAKNNVKAAKSMSLDEKEKAEKEYAEKYIEEHITELANESKALMLAELETASEDVGIITRYLDTVLDSNDMIVAAATKMLVLKKEESRRESREFRDDALDIVHKLYKESDYTYLKTPLHDVYDFMLEKDSKGNRTGFLISKFSSALMEEYREVVKNAEEFPEHTAWEMRRKWKKENMPRNNISMNVALTDYMNSLVEDDLMIATEIEAYFINSQQPIRYRRLTSNVIQNTEAANSVDAWIKDNSMSFREPTSKWINPEWNKWEEFMKNNPNSPKTQFYNLISKTIDNLDINLPFNKRKFKQLPFQFKNTDERIAAGQDVSTLIKDSFKDSTTKRLDEVGRGEYTDENDQPLNYIPWFYNRPGEKIDHIFEYKVEYSDGTLSDIKKVVIQAPSVEEATEKLLSVTHNAREVMPIKADVTGWTDGEQSYDLMGLYNNYVKMAINSIKMSEILPEMEIVSKLVSSRKYTETDTAGNPIKKIMKEINNRNLTKEGANSHIAAMFKDFYKAQIYGQEKAEEGSWDIMGWKFDKAKLADSLNKYSSYTMLGLNLVQGITNASVGELTQIVEAVAGEYLTTKDLHKATVNYGKEMRHFMGDIGSVTPRSKVGRLNEKWDILNEYEGGNYKKNSKFARLMSSSVLFFMSHAGEHFMQTRIMMAMLGKIEAKDSEGNVIGSMYDMYEVTESGRLILSDKVHLENSNWTAAQQDLFGLKVKRLLSRLHGEYSDLGKSAAQRWAIGRLGMMFRKFVVPGFKRRWEKRKVNEFLEEEVEGSYRSLFGFLNRARKELRALGMGALSENWNGMSTKEQRNIIRGAGELGMATLVAIMAQAFLTLKGEADSDEERYFYAFNAAIALRVKSEMFFFINIAETLTILKSPAVSTATIESLIKLLGQIINPTSGWELYERGSWEGSPKIYKTLVKLTPGAKQVYKVKNIEDSLTYFIK